MMYFGHKQGRGNFWNLGNTFSDFWQFFTNFLAFQ